MPIYEYQCQSCGFVFDELQSMKEEPLVKCPNCGKNELKKLIGSGSAIFKGTGFYQTDYKKPNSSPRKTESTSSKSESKSNTDSSKQETRAESKSETKSESKKESGNKKENK